MAQIFYNIPELINNINWITLNTLSALLFANSQILVGDLRPTPVYIPSTYDSTKPAPLLIFLHGFGTNAYLDSNRYNLQSALEQNGMIYMTPNGT